jgi:NAD(P)H-dependent flavin oxidoreductase YrpB (nitropropane dioxygenase family)
MTGTKAPTNRVLAHTGAAHPIVQAPMGFTLGAEGIQMGTRFGGDMEASLALASQTVGLIHEVLPVADIIRHTVESFHAIRRAQWERPARGDF